jgi:hypothetical protein
MGKLTNLNPSKALTEGDMPPGMATDTETAAAIAAHLAATDPHLQYATQLRGDARYLRLDVIPTTYGSLVIGGSKSGYAGIQFSAGFNAPTFMINTGTFQHGMWSPLEPGWQWQYNSGWLRVFNANSPTGSQTKRGSYIGLEKGFNSVPGFPNDDFPALRTDYSILYFSVGNAYSSYITTAGTYVAVSDKNKKKQSVEVDYLACLALIKKIPVYEYSFDDEPDEIRRCGPYAQDFYEAFHLGGELEDSPNSPDKMLAPSDEIGVLFAALKGLALEVEILRIRLS